MPRQKTLGRARIDMTVKPEFADLIVVAAERRQMTFSGYIRHAIIEQLQRDQFPLPAKRNKKGPNK